MDLYDEIAKMAYELYEKKGGAEGRDLENWCEAERIVMVRRAEKENVAEGETTAQTGKSGKGRERLYKNNKKLR